jgi:L-lactate dehydrogenase complex protein LldG
MHEALSTKDEAAKRGTARQAIGGVEQDGLEGFDSGVVAGYACGMNDHDEILRRLREQERGTARVPAWRSRRRFDDLAERFMEALAAGGGEVTRVAGLAEAAARLDELFAELGARRVIANCEPLVMALDPRRRWPGITWQVAGEPAGEATGSSEDQLQAFCAAADAGLTGVDAALAETGSLVVSSGSGRSRMVSLLPPVHIALVPVSSLTTDLFTWTAIRGQAMPASVTLVSGPSKTADIEQTLAVGVHGPKRLAVILVEDE